jgi:hypothetical protein
VKVHTRPLNPSKRFGLWLGFTAKRGQGAFNASCLDFDFFDWGDYFEVVGLEIPSIFSVSTKNYSDFMPPPGILTQKQAQIPLKSGGTKEN